MAGLADEIVDLYRRTFGLVRAVPLVAIISFAPAMLQHVAPGLPAIGLIKTFAMLGALIFALRWWRFDRDAAKAVRPDAWLARGVAIALAAELGGMILFGLAGQLVARAANAEAGSIAWLISATVPILLWAMLSVLLFPWFVALLTDETDMTIRRSIAAVYPIWGSAFALYAAAILPPMILRGLLAMGAAVSGGPLLALLIAADAGASAAMPLLVAASYYSIHLRVRS